MIENIREDNILNLSVENKERQMNYRNHTKLIKNIYDYAKQILDEIFGENYTLPINIELVAEKLGLICSTEQFSDIEEEALKSGFHCLPHTQLVLRKKIVGNEKNKIMGIIYLAPYLNGKSKRFYIAHQLGRLALRNQFRVDSHFKYTAFAGFYPLSNTEEMMANIFASALLLPYHLFEEYRLKFESYRTNWPIYFSKWISYISDEAQMPEYCAVLACQELNKINICLQQEKIADKIKEKLISLKILDEERQKDSLELYAKIINNLELWGFSQEKIALALFSEPDCQEEQAHPKTGFIEFIHDYYISNKTETNTIKRKYPNELIEDIIYCLKKSLNLTEQSINQIIGVESERQKILIKI